MSSNVAYEMDWESVDDRIDEFYLSKSNPEYWNPVNDPDTDCYEAPLKASELILVDRRCKCLHSQFAPLTDFCEMVNEAFRTEVLDSADHDMFFDCFDESDFDDLEYVNYALANKFHSGLRVLGIVDDVVEFVKV